MFYTWSEQGTFTGNDWHRWRLIPNLSTTERVAAAGFLYDPPSLNHPGRPALLYVFASPGASSWRPWFTTCEDPTVAGQPWATWGWIPFDNYPGTMSRLAPANKR